MPTKTKKKLNYRIKNHEWKTGSIHPITKDTLTIKESMWNSSG